MPTESIVSAILQASITGAGLVLAVYALITPLSKRIFKDRTKVLQMMIVEHDRCEDPKQREKLRVEIKKIKIFPRYLSIGVTTTFSLYMISVIGTSFWLADPTAYIGSTQELLMIASFLLANIVFAAVGLYAIIEVYSAMKKEFEEIKKKQAEVK